MLCGNLPCKIIFDQDALAADSKMLLTACDDMHSHLYDVEHASLVEAFSGDHLSCLHALRSYKWPMLCVALRYMSAQALSADFESNAACI